MSRRSDELGREAECSRIMEVYGSGDLSRIIDTLDNQYETLHNRAQVLLGICGVLISASVVVTTGRIVGRSFGAYASRAGVPLILAGALAILASAILCGNVLRIRWITVQLGNVEIGSRSDVPRQLW